jgi:hypothetical protein
VKTVRTNAPISSAKLSAIMARESLDIPGNARLAVSFINSNPSGTRRGFARVPDTPEQHPSLGGPIGMLGIKNQKLKKCSANSGGLT